MKLFLKAIALAAKDPKFQGNARDELNRLIDVAECSCLPFWHDDRRLCVRFGELLKVDLRWGNQPLIDG